MKKTILAILLLTLIPSFLVSCQNWEINDKPRTAPTLSEIVGTWKSTNSFYLILDDQDRSFSFADSTEAAKSKIGPHGRFLLIGSELLLQESTDSEICPDLEGRFQAEIVREGNMRLTIIDDPCIYRVEGLFEGGQGGNRFLEFRRLK